MSVAEAVIERYLPTGTYFVDIEKAAGNAIIPSYFLAVDYQDEHGVPAPGALAGTACTAPAGLEG